MEKRFNKDRRRTSAIILSDINERRRILDRRQSGLEVKELYVSERAFDLMFKAYIADKSRS